MFFSGYMPRSGTAGSYGSFIPSVFNLHTVFDTGWIILHPHQQSKRIPSTSYPLQHLLFVDFLFDDGHYNQCEAIPHCSFDLHFSNNERFWASFHVISSGKLSYITGSSTQSSVWTQRGGMRVRWEGRSRGKERMYTLIYVVVQQKPKLKAIILQSKVN